jgi:hypothetical protein
MEHRETDERDPDATTIATVTIAGTIVLIAVVLAVQGLYESANRAEFSRKVVAVAPIEIRDLRAAQLARLRSTGWVDKKNEIVAIPIEKAMELLAKEPDPAAPVTGAK